MKGTGKGTSGKIDTSSPNKAISLSNCSETIGRKISTLNSYSMNKGEPQVPKGK